MDIITLHCTKCSCVKGFFSSIIAWEEGWELEAPHLCPECAEVQKINEVINNIGHPQPNKVDREQSQGTQREAQVG